MNRQQRRAADKMASKARSNGQTPVQTMQQLQQPEPAGELTVSEAAELRARNKIYSDAQKDFQAKQEATDQQRKILFMLQHSLTVFTRELVTAHGLALDAAQYSVSDETGVISKVAVLVDTDAPPHLKAVEAVSSEPEPVSPEA